jgi:serine phosphatase RsbU (regulator of sigma subunit)
MIACADSTGHGVPGAFLSIVGAQLINHAVGQEWDVPSDILKIIDKGLIKTLTGNNGETIADGMDMAFCIIDPKEKKIDFAGAMSSIILNESGKSQVYKGSRFGLGKYMKAKEKYFETQVIEYKSGDMLYLYSDGLKDQFGGDDDKKFMAKRQTALFEKVHHLPNHEQKEIIIKTFEEWKGEQNQVDDVMVIGVRL